MGMIIGEHSRDNDLEINVLKGKQLTNIRAAGKDEAVRLTPPRMTLEQALAYIEDDELVERFLNHAEVDPAVAAEAKAAAEAAEAERAARRAAKPVLTEAEQKAARDARYAARKARKGKR
jgi:predicted membrane GTPase involved in stress response